MLNNFFMIVGGQKCGTTSMHNWLGQHPNITMSYPKEPKFFEIDYYKGPQWYEDTHFTEHWIKGPDDFHGEARVQNILVGYVPDRIEEYDPNTKIVMMIRNPVDRFVSAWNHFRVMRPGREIRTLQHAVYEGIHDFDMNCFKSEELFAGNLDPKGGPYGGRYLEHGMWVDLIRRFERFDTHIIVMEDLARHPKIVYEKLLDFLGAKHYEPEFNRLNSKEYGDIELQAVRDLSSYYKYPVMELSDYLDRDLTTEWGFNK